MEKKFPLESLFFVSNILFHIRLTSPDLTIEKTYDALAHTPQLVVAGEGDGNDKAYHQHVLVCKVYQQNQTDRKDQESAFKNELREIVLKLYPECKGNKGHSIKIARNAKSLLSYVVKGDDYKFHGFKQEFIEAAKAVSYDMDEFKYKFNELKDGLTLAFMGKSKDKNLDGPSIVRKYCDDLLALKCEHGQPIVLHHIRSHYLSVLIKYKVLTVASINNKIFEELGIEYTETKHVKPEKHVRFKQEDLLKSPLTKSGGAHLISMR